MVISHQFAYLSTIVIEKYRSISIRMILSLNAPKTNMKVVTYLWRSATLELLLIVVKGDWPVDIQYSVVVKSDRPVGV